MTLRTEMVHDKDYHISCLEETNKALSEKLAFLNKRMMAKNSEQATKWQNKAFYWKRKYLDAIERLTTLGQSPCKKGDGDEREICNLSGEEAGRGR